MIALLGKKPCRVISYYGLLYNLGIDGRFADESEMQEDQII
jgi:hypothetical protein